MNLTAQLYMLKGMIAEIDQVDRDLTLAAAEEVRVALKAIETKYGDHSICGIGIVLLERAIESEKEG